METNSIIYKTSRTLPHKKIDVNIRLNDECKNGHADFAITGTVYEKDKRGDWKWTSCGCCHDEILKAFKEFKPFIDLHLSDQNGAPMYAVGNGIYHLRNSSKETAMNYIRCTEEEYNVLIEQAEDDLYFKYLIYSLGIVDRWKTEADQAIKQLEELTGKKWKPDFPKSNLKPFTEEEDILLKARIAAGYYTPAAIAHREEMKAEVAKHKEIIKLHAGAQKAIDKIETELQVKLYVLSAGMPLDSFIYYDHSNEGVFNWMGQRSYMELVTQEQFDGFVSRLDFSKLPNGISFKLGK